MQAHRTRTRRRTVAALTALTLAGLAAPASAVTATGSAVTVAPPSPGSATFVNYVAPAGLARDAGEPTLGANWKTGRVMFQAFTETDQVSFDDTQFPAVAAWKDVSSINTSITTLDPILETDSVTGRTFVSQLTPPCSNSAYTDTDGEGGATGYTPFLGCGVGSNFDHQTIGTGPVPPGAAPSPVYGPNRLVYYCSQVVVESTCSVSRTGGNTFEVSRPVYTFKGLVNPPALVGCEGLHGHLNTSPVDGTAYLPNFACNSAAAPAVDRPSVVVSPDGGLTWTIRQVPDGASPNFDSDPAVDVDLASTAYVAYEDVNSNLMVTTSTDRGATFAPSVDLGAPLGLKNATMPAVIAGSAGRAAVAFMGTVAEAPANTAGKPENQLFAFDPDGDDPTAGWHAYISMTYDGGRSWTTTDVTPSDPVQRGCIWWGSAEGSGGAAAECQNNKRNLLDFNDVTVDRVGRVLYGWADGCVNACVTQGHQVQSNTAFAARPDQSMTRQQFDELYSQEDIGTITRQSCGRGLYEAFDADPAGPLATCASLAGVDPIVPEVPVVPAMLVAGLLAAGGVAVLRRRGTASVA